MGIAQVKHSTVALQCSKVCFLWRAEYSNFFLQLGEAVIKARGNGRALKNLKLSENIVVEILSESLNGVRKL